jgi:hypothetical protein
MALDPSIALGIRPLEVANPLTQYAQVAQLQSMQRQGEVSQMQLDSMKRDRDMLAQISAKAAANGGPSDPNEIANAYISSGNPEFVKFGLTMQEKLQGQKMFTDYLKSKGFGAPAAGAPAPMGGAPAPMATAPVNAMAPMGSAPVNAMAPRPAMTPAPVNALANEQTILNDIRMLSASNDPRAKAEVDVLKTQLTEMRKIPTEVREFQYAETNPAFEAYQTRLKRASAITVPISVSTEKKYGEQFAGKMADTDIAKMTTAEKAPQLAESANRIIDLVKQGNVFTGPVADVKLNIARALNVVGASNNEKIANTESLIAATGQSTLDAIKGAGLGTGQGFTDKDLKFLQGVAGGKIELTAQTLTELARLQHQTATRSADAWNTRAKQLPKSSIEGTGLSIEPIKVPPLSPSAMFAVNPKTGERIQSVDGGNTWKPVGAK